VPIFGITVAINLIADPIGTGNDSRHRPMGSKFQNIVTISVNTPYPGTETWLTEPRKIQSPIIVFRHPACPATTTLPLPDL